MNAFKFNRASRSDFPTIQKIFEQAPDYFMKVEGKLANAETVPYEFESRPDHIPLENKRTYIIHFENEAIGLVDAILGHPTAVSACIGLFLLVEKFQGIGWGREAYTQWEKQFVEEYKPTFIRLWVAETNDVMGFWKNLGYVYDGVNKEYKATTQTIKIFEMEKSFKT